MARYLFASQNKRQKEKQKGKRKKQKKPTYLGHPGPTHLSSRPSPRSSSVVFLPARQSSSLERPSTPWTPPRRPAASRPPQDVKERHGDALDSLSHFPPSPLRPELSLGFPLLPRERPPCAAVRIRSQRRQEPEQPCPPCAASSISSIWRSWRPNRARGRRHLHQRLAGAATRFLQFRPAPTSYDFATASVGLTVSSRIARAIPTSSSSSLASFTMRAEAPRRREPWRQPPEAQSNLPPCLTPSPCS